jgi:hypothetical protein
MELEENLPTDTRSQVDRRTNMTTEDVLFYFLKKTENIKMGVFEPHLYGIGQRPVGGSCDHGNERSSFIKGRKFVD